MNTHIKFTCLLTIVMLLFSCGEEKKETKKIKRPVKYETVGFLGGEKIRTFSGTAQTDKIITLSFRSSGILTFLDIKVGQSVKKGQLLAKLDNVQSRLSYESAVSTMNSANSQMNTAKLALNRTRSLFEKGRASLSDFEAAKNSYKTASESYESSKRSVAIQKEQVNYGYLYAPENGVIADIQVELDENVSAGRSIATLNAGNDMEIVIGIPESVINGVKENMDVNVQFPSLANQSFKAKVTEVSPAVEASTSTYPVRVTVYNPSEEIKSGMAANVTFDFGERKTNTKSLVVPASAVGEDSNGRFVFLIQGDADNAIVKKQKVTIGALSNEGFEITSGLQSGQKIATAGLQTLLDGQEVKLQ